MVRRVAENQVTIQSFAVESRRECHGAEYLGALGEGRRQGNVVPSTGRHRWLYPASHGINDKSARRCEVVKCVGNNPWRDRSGVGNAKGAVMAESTRRRKAWGENRR